MITRRCSRSGPGVTRTWAGRAPRWPAGCTRCCGLVPGGVSGEITAGQAGQILPSITLADTVEAARCQLAAELTEDLRGVDARIRGTRTKTAAAPAQPWPRLLRQETGRGQDPERSPALPETPDQRRHLRLPAGRRPARRGQEPGRATGEPLCNQGGRLTPRPPALRASHSRACHPPYGPRCSLSRAAAISCERVAGSRTGRSPAAQRRPQGVLDAAPREPIMPAAGKEGVPDA